MNLSPIFDNLGTIVSGLSFVGYVVASLSFILSMKSEMKHLSEKLDRCEEEIAELRKLVIDLVIGLSHGKTISQETENKAPGS